MLVQHKFEEKLADWEYEMQCAWQQGLKGQTVKDILTKDILTNHTMICSSI